MLSIQKQFELFINLSTYIFNMDNIFVYVYNVSASWYVSLCRVLQNEQQLSALPFATQPDIFISISAAVLAQQQLHHHHRRKKPPPPTPRATVWPTLPAPSLSLSATALLGRCQRCLRCLRLQSMKDLWQHTYTPHTPTHTQPHTPTKTPGSIVAESASFLCHIIIFIMTLPAAASASATVSTARYLRVISD